MTSKKRLSSTVDLSLPKAKRQALRNEESFDCAPSKITTDTQVRVELRYNSALCVTDFQHLSVSHPIITHLDLTGCFDLSPHTFPLILQTWGASLRSLNLGWCHYLAENLHLMPPTTSHLPLKTLNLDNSNISDRGVRYFATRSPDLSDINLASCPISDLSLSLIAQFCKKVEVLNLSGCDKITNYGVQIVAQEMKSLLRELNLNDCRNVNGKALEYLKFYCDGLTRLMLRDTGVTGDEIVQLCDVLSLTELNLHGLPITDDHLRLISSSQPSLEILDISFCRDVTEEGIKCLVRETPNLQELHAYGKNLSCEDFGDIAPDLKIFS